jgi:hypothetical protein
MLRFGFILIAALAVLACPVKAQPNTEAAPKTTPAQGQKIPDSFKLSLMIKTTVIAVNQANKTNNYTVLRDLGSPRFKEANSAKRLGEIFAALRRTNFDLSPVLFFTPKIVAPPALTDDGMLRLTGYFDTVPQRVSFDMLFEDIEGAWKLYGINIATERSPAVGEKAPAREQSAK